MASRISVGVAELVEPQVLAAGGGPHWTTKRMNAAKPLRLPSRTAVLRSTVTPQKLKSAASLQFPRERIVSYSVPPDDPKIQLLSFGASFTTTLVGDKATTFPYCAIGKLFMTFPTGDFVGSAWVIGKTTIFTAGHCLYFPEYGGAATKVMFVANYNGGGTGTQYTVIKKAVPNAWLNNKDFTADMGICIVDGPVQSKQGKLGYEANQDPFDKGPYTEVGYPAEFLSDQYPFDGNEMWQSVGDFSSNPEPVADGVGTIQAGGNMTGGCSGGPWADAEDSFRVVGLNSHRDQGDTNNMISPYFGDRFVEMLNWMSENGGDS